MKTNFILKNDRFRKNRGGHSRFLQLFCDKCGYNLAIYQKDGPGILKRLYLDRIIFPKELSDGKSKNLKCKNCNTLLGILIIYEKENRLAYRLFAGAIGKKIIKGKIKI
ncbi:MAG: hypothetical protein NTX82_02240 [Candidatus Parcubacteria bacterium]|nr:hypothetical protein [Candidatus Parcubacteria bacterium]